MHSKHMQLISCSIWVARKTLAYLKVYCLDTLILPDIEEQTAIAEVLSAADREIDLLRQDIEQEKQKKKALMQLLLTGIVRVKT